MTFAAIVLAAAVVVARDDLANPALRGEEVAAEGVVRESWSVSGGGVVLSCRRRAASFLVSVPRSEVAPQEYLDATDAGQAAHASQDAGHGADRIRSSSRLGAEGCRE